MTDDFEPGFDEGAGEFAQAQRDSAEPFVLGMDDADDEIPQKPMNELTPAEQVKLAAHVIAEIDDHPEGIPFLPLDLTALYVWSIETVFMPPVVPGGEPEPGVIVTFASPQNPRGTPVIFPRDRALKLASQIKKAAQTGPSLEQRAAQTGIAVPPSAGGKLILPGQ